MWLKVSGSFNVTGSVGISPTELLEIQKDYVLGYDDTSGRVFKMTTSSIVDGEESGFTVYKTGSSDNNIIPKYFKFFTLFIRENF